MKPSDFILLLVELGVVDVLLWSPFTVTISPGKDTVRKLCENNILSVGNPMDFRREVCTAWASPDYGVVFIRCVYDDGE